MKTWVGLLAIGVTFWHGASFGFDVTQYQWDQFADDFTLNEKDFRGEWNESRDWRGTLCNGHYDYQNHLTGRIDKIDLKLREDGTLDAYGDLASIHTGLTGKYRSSYSLCRTVSGWYGIGIDRAEIYANVTFIDQPNGADPEVKVRITGTRLGQIRLGSWMPDFVETTLTRIVNAGLQQVWKTRLGGWISDRVSKEIKKKWPKQP